MSWALCSSMGAVVLLLVAIVAWHHGRIIGERDEARRMLRYVNGDDMRDAVREAVAAGPRYGEQPEPWPGKR